MSLIAHKYPVQDFGIVSGGQCARLLHMTSEVPELLQPDLRDIDDVIGLVDWSFWIRSPRYRRAKGHHKAGQVLVEGKKPKTR